MTDSLDCTQGNDTRAIGVTGGTHLGELTVCSEVETLYEK